MGLSDAQGLSPPRGHASERFALTRLLGQGGMAFVYEATEVATGRRVALKRLQPHTDHAKYERNAELFEREFHALSQLAHPRIVAVYDYGVDDAGPYYTMELLDGGDLQQLAPVPWRQACAIARDVASALSLLHSRRLVHRDVSPRNVRRTQDGHAKLIDFGAMAPVGPSKFVVGTPPCCAPETVGLQALDGRTDLFALGATLYYMLIGRHAYGARQFSLLSDAWQLGFPPPAALVPDIPPALDALVVDLLRLEPDARPSNAAEVIQRLCAIDGELPGEQLRVAGAYLSRPTLVGRDLSLARVRRRFERTAQRGSATVVIEGGAGVGRSRFLDACALDAALLGLTVVRADTDDGSRGDYGVLRALTHQLLTMLPASAMQAARPGLSVLRRFIPELSAGAEEHGVTGVAANATRAQLVAAVQTWFRALARDKALVIAIDDFHRIDESSAALMSLLAHDGGEGVCFLFSVEKGAASSSAQAQKLLAESATHIKLEPLTLEESDSLLKSLFGDIPNIGTFARRLHELASGRPRDLLRLSQHLIDRGVVHYDAGAWTLTAEVDTADLPTSIAQTLRAQLETLNVSALELAAGLSLCPDLSFTFEECNALCERRSAAEFLADVERLARNDIVRYVDEQLRLAHEHWVALIRETLPPVLERALHARLAKILTVRGSSFRAGQHWLGAGEITRGLDVLVAHAAASQEQTSQSSEVAARYARSLPANWMDTFERAIQLCEALDRPKRDAFVLRGRMAGIVSAFGVDDRGHVATLLADLEQYSGLADWQELDPALGPQQRAELAMQRAEARFAETPPQERVIEPKAALRLLPRATQAATARVVVGLDLPYLRSWPSLAPFAPISPGLRVISKLVEGIDARFSGRVERSRASYTDVLSYLDRPDHGLDPAYAELNRLGMLNALGIIDACSGLASSLQRAERTASHSAYQVHAVLTTMIYRLFQGDVRAADQCKKQAERIRLETLALYQTTHLLWEVMAYTLSEDLTRMRHSLEQAAALAQRFEPWQAMHYYIGAEYDRVRRDHPQALRKIQLALDHARAGWHPVWASMAGAHVRILFELGRWNVALQLAEAYVATAEREELGESSDHLVLALSVCQAQAGQRRAVQTADAVVDRLVGDQVGGLNLGVAFEMRARVSLLLKDENGFNHYAESCREVYCRHKNPALFAKYKRLRQEAQRNHLVIARQSSDTPDSFGTYTGTRIVAALEFCKGLEQRAKLALTILARQSGARGGVLYTVGDNGLESIGTVGDVAVEPELEARVQTYFAEQMQQAADATATETDAAAPAEMPAWIDTSGQAFRPVLLSHNAEGTTAVIGVALLALSETTPFVHPLQVATAISRFWADSGYTSMLLMDD